MTHDSEFRLTGYSPGWSACRFHTLGFAQTLGKDKSCKQEKLKEGRIHSTCKIYFRKSIKFIQSRLTKMHYNVKIYIDN